MKSPSTASRALSISCVGGKKLKEKKRDIENGKINKEAEDRLCDREREIEIKRKRLRKL